jgi:hypothetical protein
MVIPSWLIVVFPRNGHFDVIFALWDVNLMDKNYWMMEQEND